MYSGAENDPIISALSEAAATFPLTEDFDFVVSLGTGEPKLKNDDTSAYGSSNVWKNGAFPRLCNMAGEKCATGRIDELLIRTFDITVSMLSLTMQNPGWMMRGAFLSLDQKFKLITQHLLLLLLNRRGGC